MRFSKLTVSKNFYQEYHQDGLTARIQIGPGIMSGLTLVPIGRKIVTVKHF